MARTYRGNGAWGTGKGSNLTEAEFDNNTYTDQLAIQDLVDNPPEARSIDTFSQVGSQFYVNMTDATQEGPFQLPSPALGAAPWRRIADATYPTVLGDAGRMIHCEIGCTIILSSSLYSDGAEIHVRQQSASAVIFETDSGATVEAPTGDDARTGRQGAVATAKWDETEGKWYVWGNLAEVSA